MTKKTSHHYDTQHKTKKTFGCITLHSCTALLGGKYNKQNIFHSQIPWNYMHWYNQIHYLKKLRGSIYISLNAATNHWSIYNWIHCFCLFFPPVFMMYDVRAVASTVSVQWRHRCDEDGGSSHYPACQTPGATLRITLLWEHSASWRQLLRLAELCLIANILGAT